jgi:hypothetical protein
VLCWNALGASHGLADVVGIPAWMREFIHPCACCDIQPRGAQACKMARLAVLCGRHCVLVVHSYLLAVLQAHSRPRRLACTVVCRVCSGGCSLLMHAAVQFILLAYVWAIARVLFSRISVCRLVAHRVCVFV